MIDQFNDDGTGWARFSDDMTMRFRLARSLTKPLTRLQIVDGRVVGLMRWVFLLLNPSDATAFKPDPTVTDCRKRAFAGGADVLEVVNLFAFRSPYPTDLKKRAAGSRGDDMHNNHAIMDACDGAAMVIAAWGNDGGLGARDVFVLDLLRHKRVPLYHLGVTRYGFPKHPLARGKHRIPADLKPQLWSAA